MKNNVSAVYITIKIFYIDKACSVLLILKLCSFSPTFVVYKAIVSPSTKIEVDRKIYESPKIFHVNINIVLCLLFNRGWKRNHES